ncbi:hypothetical protein DTO063F5_8868 [Paecilomyces variotii]|nr:hypothetical protein DTO063F5_8868 [Paecilomyces variotii]
MIAWVLVPGEIPALGYLEKKQKKQKKQKQKQNRGSTQSGLFRSSPDGRSPKPPPVPDQREPSTRENQRTSTPTTAIRNQQHPEIREARYYYYYY